MKHRATSTEAAHIAAMKDFVGACQTAVDLYRRRHHGRGDWALVRAGRRVALALGVPFEDHPLGDLIYIDPCKITPVDIARQQKARAAAAAQAGVLS